MSNSSRLSRSGLADDPLADADLADIVQDSGDMHLLELRGGHADVPCDCHGVLGHIRRVPPGVRVFGLHRRHERLYRTEIVFPQVFEERCVFHGSHYLARQDEGDLEIACRERYTGEFAHAEHAEHLVLTDKRYGHGRRRHILEIDGGHDLRFRMLSLRR